MKSSGFRNLVRRDAPWRTPRSEVWTHRTTYEDAQITITVVPLWAKRGLRSTLRASNLQNIPGRAYPQTPLAFPARIQTVRLPNSLPPAVVYGRSSGEMSDAEVAVRPNCLRAQHSLLVMEALLNAPAIFFFVGEGGGGGGGGGSYILPHSTIYDIAVLPYAIVWPLQHYISTGRYFIHLVVLSS